MIAYAAIRRVSMVKTPTSMFAVSVGAAIALLALHLEYNTSNVIAVAPGTGTGLRELVSSSADATAVVQGSAAPAVALFEGPLAAVPARINLFLSTKPRAAIKAVAVAAQLQLG